MTQPLEIDTSSLPRALVVRARGDIDMASAPEVGAEVLQAARTHESECLVLELGAVEYIDSSGLELLFRLHAELAGSRELITIAPPGSTAARLLGLVALGDVGEIRPSLEAALDCADPGPG
jgi:anti-sigma B factor antagonist